MARQYSKRQLEMLWISAGGPRNVASTAAAIALAESGGNPMAKNPESPAAGLWQINGQVISGNIYNPRVNAKNAVKKYKEAGGFTPWVTYTSGAYKTFADIETPFGNINAPGPNFDPLAPFDAPFKAGKDIIEKPGNIVDAVGELAKFFTLASKLLFTPEGWLQVGQVAGGVGLLVWGIHHLIGVTTGVDVVKSGKHAAIKAAEVAAVVK